MKKSNLLISEYSEERNKLIEDIQKIRLENKMLDEWWVIDYSEQTFIIDKNGYLLFAETDQQKNQIKLITFLTSK